MQKKSVKGWRQQYDKIFNFFSFLQFQISNKKDTNTSITIQLDASYPSFFLVLSRKRIDRTKIWEKKNELFTGIFGAKMNQLSRDSSIWHSSICIRCDIGWCVTRRTVVLNLRVLSDFKLIRNVDFILKREHFRKHSRIFIARILQRKMCFR